MFSKLFEWLAWVHGGNKKPAEVCRELHSFVQGFCEVACPWPPRHTMGRVLRKEIESEHHYYVAGRVVGLVALVLGVLGVVVLLKAVIL
jgi:hypothetical protein